MSRIGAAWFTLAAPPGWQATSAGLAMDGLDFDVRRGEILGLMGPNSAGKTRRTTQ